MSYSDRIFDVFLKEGEAELSFEEFAQVLSILCSVRGTWEEKTQLAFKCYDLNGDGKISTHELDKALRNCLRENRVPLHKCNIDLLVKETFRQADLDQDGFIDATEFTHLSECNRSVVLRLSTDLSSVLQDSQ